MEEVASDCSEQQCDALVATDTWDACSDHTGSSGSTSSHDDEQKELYNIDLSHKGLRVNDLNKIISTVIGQCVIQNVGLSFNELGNNGAVAVSRFLANNDSIKCLDLSFNGIKDDGAIAIALALMSNKSLTVLFLSGNLIHSVGFRAIANCMLHNTVLTSLHLTGNSGCAEGAVAISGALAKNKTITTFCFNGAKVISHAIRMNHTITHLNLSDNNIGDVGVIHLSLALEFHRCLNVLELSFNAITPLGMRALVMSLRDYESLQRFSVDNNKIGDGARMLAHVISSMQIEYLNLGFNEISTEGMLEIINSVCSSSTLHTFNLSGNSVNVDVTKSLACFILNSQSLRYLHLDHSCLSPLCEKHIASAVASNKHSVLKQFTGFDLGRVLLQLGSPPIFATLSNDAALKYLKECWEARKEQGSVRKRTKVTTITEGVESLSTGNEPSRSDSGSFLPTSPSTDPPYLRIARDIASLPFNSAELWQLHQYYFSPVPISSPDEGAVPGKTFTITAFAATTPPTLPVDINLQCQKRERALSVDMAHPVDESADKEKDKRPRKKANTVGTIVRIGKYPRIKHQFEQYKIFSNDAGMLHILRQLKFLEEELEDKVAEIEDIFFKLL